MEFGLPDLAEDGLAPEKQNARLKRCVAEHLLVFKDGRKLRSHLIPRMVEFLEDLFFERVQQVILVIDEFDRYIEYETAHAAEADETGEVILL